MPASIIGKQDLVNEIADDAGLNKTQAAKALDELNKEVQQLRQQVKEMKSRAAGAAEKN